MTPWQAAFTLRSGSTHPYVRIALDCRSQSAPSGRRQALLSPCLPPRPVCRSEPVRGFSPAHRNAKDHAVDRPLIHRLRYGPSRLTRNTAARAPNSNADTCVQRTFARRLLIVQVEADQLGDDRDPDYADQSTGVQNMPNRGSPLVAFLTCSPDTRHGGRNHQKTSDLQQPKVQVEAVTVGLDVVAQNRGYRNNPSQKIDDINQCCD